MTLQEILMLGKMGYTKADIDAMEREKAADDANINADPKPATPTVPASPAAPAAPAAPVAPAAPAEPPKAEGTELDRLFSKLSELTAALQASNRAAAEMGANIIDPRAEAVGALATLSGLNIKTDKEV